MTDQPDHGHDAAGQFPYKVTGQEIVSPSDVAVLDPTADNGLTLTACHPKYSASKRIVDARRR